MNLRFLKLIVTILFMVMGAIVGFKLGVYYQEHLAKNYRPLLNPLTAFTILGILFGFLISSYSLRRIIKLSSNLENLPIEDKIAIIIGIILALIVSALLSPILRVQGGAQFGTVLVLVATFVILYLFINFTVSMKEELLGFFPTWEGKKDEQDRAQDMSRYKILDTNVVIDGRIYDICRCGFIEGPVSIPNFVLTELQLLADSSDEVKRLRGKRGLEILNQLKKDMKLQVRVFDEQREDLNDDLPTDEKLIRLAKRLNAYVVTNDVNLKKVAEFKDVKILNINELATALKPLILPGDENTVNIVKEGKEEGQGIAYLDDGTMVVVEKAAKHVGESVRIIVTSILQTIGGKMVFSRLKYAGKYEEELVEVGKDSHSNPSSRL